MELADLLPAIRSLPRADKLRLIELMAADVAKEVPVGNERADATIPVWSPHESFEAAAALLRVLEKGEVAS